MPNINQKDAKDYAFQFLMEEHNFAAEERWKYAASTWEAFKFYVTLVTGAGAFILAVLSIGLNPSVLSAVVSVSTGIVFVIGILVFLRMIVLDLDLEVTRRRLRTARKTISQIASLEGYFTELQEIGAGLALTPSSGYSFKAQVKRAMIGAGLKTQIVIMNSFTGMISIVGGVISFGMVGKDGLVGTVILAAISYFCLISLHIFIARARETRTRA